MKTVIKRGLPGFRIARLGSIAAVSLCLAGGAAFAAEVVDAQMSSPNPNVLPWISEVVKMNDAGVPQDVIANYVKNTSARSTLSADDIIYLHTRNVPTPIVTAMIEHGAAVPAAAPVASVPMPTTPAPTPVYGYPSTATYAQTPPDDGSDQTQPVVNYNYYGSSGYGYNYPYYSSYYPYYYYPVWWYYPYGRYCYRPGFGYCRTGFNNGFHVHSNGAVHFNGGGGFHASSSISHGSFAMGGMGGGMHR
jgi:hypothetical protein